MKLAKFNEIGRLLLTKCGVDAKIFLSDVYNKRTQAKKHQADAHQYGRSMVEMLGVLAIIGVLSVGAIAGYSKAMFKYKMNKTMDILSQVFVRVAELKEMRLTEDISTPEQLRDYGFECQIVAYNEYMNVCELPVGLFILTMHQGNSGKVQSHLELMFTSSDKNIACVNFLSSDIVSEIIKNTPSNEWDEGKAAIVIANDQDVQKTLHWSGNEFIDDNNKTVTIMDVCSVCLDGSMCGFIWVM